MIDYEKEKKCGEKLKKIGKRKTQHRKNKQLYTTYDKPKQLTATVILLPLVRCSWSVNEVAYSGAAIEHQTRAQDRGNRRNGPVRSNAWIKKAFRPVFLEATIHTGSSPISTAYTRCDDVTKLSIKPRRHVGQYLLCERKQQIRTRKRGDFYAKVKRRSCISTGDQF